MPAFIQKADIYFNEAAITISRLQNFPDLLSIANIDESTIR